MIVLGELEKCRRYIESHPKEKNRNKRSFHVGPCITISREAGTCARCVSEKLVKFFRHKVGDAKPGWNIFDKNLIEKVLEDYNFPETLKNLLEEDKVSFFSSMLNEMISGLPGQWTLIHKQSETILQIASLGNVIIIGRGANIITQNLQNTFHVRLIAPLNERIKNFAVIHGLQLKKAGEIVEKHDNNRMKFINTVFNKRIDDLSLYHLVINTKGLTYKQTASIIGSAVIEKLPDLFDQSHERHSSSIISYLH